MIRFFAILLALVAHAVAAGPLELRVADALRASSLLPDAAEIEIVRMTSVRGAVERIEIKRFDPRTGLFDAIIAHGQTEAPIQGRAQVSIPVVVARATMRRDYEITAGDVEIRQVPMNQVPVGALSLPEDVIGQAVRRSLVAGRPVRQEDIGAPIVIRKNAVVDVVYETAGMSLSMSGRALDQGAVGDMVRVAADGNGMTVVGEVLAPGRVSVR